MDYEKKYKEALEIARKINSGEEVAAPEGWSICEVIFPDLKESEDEESKKWILEYLYDGLRKSDAQFKDQFKTAIAWLEKQGEKKPADKVEPNFKVGDWIVFNENHNSIYQVERIDNYRYYLRHYLGGTLSVHFDNELIRQWTIADAKDGDVLSDGTTIFIFKDLLSDGSVMSYCDYDTDSGESDDFCPSVSLMCSKIIPATNEQRDVLFAKMREAGYEWDNEKKELRKIEQKSAWSEEDECHMSECISAIATKDTWSFEEKRRAKHWLKSLKQRMEEQQ